MFDECGCDVVCDESFVADECAVEVLGDAFCTAGEDLFVSIGLAVDH